jgi:hypothetical protein
MAFQSFGCASTVQIPLEARGQGSQVVEPFKIGFLFSAEAVAHICFIFLITVLQKNREVKQLA